MLTLGITNFFIVGIDLELIRYLDSTGFGCLLLISVAFISSYDGDKETVAILCPKTLLILQASAVYF